jgi:hypothetical protein
MSKFEELCQAYDEAYQDISNYLEECGKFIGKLVPGIKSYFQCPDGRIEYKDRNGNKTSLRESMYLENGFWRVNIGINLSRENGERRFAVSDSGLYYPSQMVDFSVLTKRTKTESFIVKIEGCDREFIISTNSQEEVNAFYEFVCSIIREHYKNMLRYIIEHGKIPQRLGEDV